MLAEPLFTNFAISDMAAIKETGDDVKGKIVRPIPARFNTSSNQIPVCAPGGRAARSRHRRHKLSVATSHVSLCFTCGQNARLLRAAQNLSLETAGGCIRYGANWLRKGIARHGSPIAARIQQHGLAAVVKIAARGVQTLAREVKHKADVGCGDGKFCGDDAAKRAARPPGAQPNLISSWCEAGGIGLTIYPLTVSSPVS